MFKKGPDIDKKKLLSKASDVKKDSLTRLKHFKTLIEHLDFTETHSLFKSHFSFIYHTFIDTFSTFDCNSKQRRDDLECILFIFEKIIIYNPELIKKRWQFYSITFVMQKLLHQNNTWQLRQEGVRLFVLWYQILCDETNAELQQIFGTLVPDIVPKSSLPSSTPSQQMQQSAIHQQEQQYSHAKQTQQQTIQKQPQLSMKLCSIEPLVPRPPNEQLPNDEPSFYLDNLLQYMVTQTTKPFWTSPDEARKNQELGFSFVFSMFKKIYLQHLFPNFSTFQDPALLNQQTSSVYSKSHYVNQYVDDSYEDARYDRSGSVVHSLPNKFDLTPSQKKSSYSNFSSSSMGGYSNDQEQFISLSDYQAVVIKWLTRILRQDMIPGQDELIKPGNLSSVERRDHENRDASSVGLNDSENVYVSEGNSTTIFHGIETSSKEMDIARRVIGTWSDNIAVVHELFRRAFLNFYQPASMKRVVNVYKEWICSGGPNQANQSRNLKIGYTSFNDLLQTFVLNSSNAFLTSVHSSSMLDEQFEMCKRIMNIYRYMVMKIYMNTSTWEQLLNVMIMITEQLYSSVPPERKESTIGGRIAPAFFQTFIVSWIRANLYVHISPQMWYKFHGVMRGLIRWRELVEEWGTTMSSLTRVFVKHVYGLSLADLPLERPQDRRRRPKALKSFSTAEATSNSVETPNATGSKISAPKRAESGRPPRSGSVRLPSTSHKDLSKSLTRSNSDGALVHNLKLYYSASMASSSPLTPKKVRKIKSEYLIFASDLSAPVGLRSGSPNTDAIDGTSLKDSMIIEHDQALDSHHSGKSSNESFSASQKNRKPDSKVNSDKCVLLGGNVRGWTPENSVIMWRRMLGLFGNINQFDDPENHLVAIKCLAAILGDFIKTRENLGISLDNQSTPEHPELIPPYTYPIGWLLEATHLPKQYKEGRLVAYKLLCTMSIRRHDIELPHQYYASFYETLQRGLTSPDPSLHASIIANSTQLLSFELPGCTFLVQSLYERCRAMLLTTNMRQEGQTPPDAYPRDQAVQILNTLLALHRPIKKLMVLKSESNSAMKLAAPGDLKSKVLETLLTCNTRPIILDSQTRSKSLCSLAIHVYQELCDKNDSLYVEKLLDTLLTELQDPSNSVSFRMNCDLLRLFADHATTLTNSRPTLMSSLIQTVCQLIVRLSIDGAAKNECIHFLLICLEDWCMAVNKDYLIKPMEQMSIAEDDDRLAKSLNDSLITIVLRSLENVIHDEQFIDETSNRGTRGSANTSKNSDTNSSSGRQSQGKGSNSGGSQRDRTLTNDQIHQVTTRNQQQQQHHEDQNKNIVAIKLACRVSHLKLITYLGHFPFRQVGPATMSCCVNELDYLTTADQQDHVDMNNTGGLLLLVVGGDTILSFIGSDMNSDGLHQPVHLIIRNLCGKYSWDMSAIELNAFKPTANVQEGDSIMLESDSFQEVASRASMKFDSDFNDDGTSNSSRASSNRDCIGDLMNYLSNNLAIANGYSSSSCHNMQRSKRNSAQSVSNPKYKIAQAEETMIALLTNQRFQELNHCEKSDDNDRVIVNIGGSNKMGARTSLEPAAGGDSLALAHSTDGLNTNKLLTFEQCRQLVQQLGYLSWEKRCKIDSLAKSPRLMRELKNLDSQPGRETHKIAVIYVAAGQEDKNSILINSSGSKAFEDFVSGLGWEVNLASHLGFKGGLQSNKSTGETSPYYCNGTTEVMYHVSTRFPINRPADEESLNRKLRHLGNDEIHIVWSEHSRDYRRGIIPTEFGDVIIAIYPMLTFQGYYRIQISSKHDVPSFGPLFDNCIVHQTGLAPLVRATAINASRAKRLKLPYYQLHFEERCRLIETIVQNHREKLSFEEFAVQLYGTSELGRPSVSSTATTPSGQHPAGQDTICYT